MKRHLLLVLMICTCLYLIGCSSNASSKDDATTKDPTPTTIITSIANVTPNAVVTQTPEQDTLSAKEFIPSEENVKLIGRTCLLGDTLWLALSASGIEFTFTGTKADINLQGDNNAIAGLPEGNFCRYGIYVNDELVVDDLMKEPKKTITVFASTTEETVKIKVIKLSEAANSSIGIGKISVVTKEAIHPVESKTHSIEFIGDSITCGFGVDDSDVNGAFSTATEDATKTYAYKTAQALDVDYSFVAQSGYGIISGYTSNGKLNSAQVMGPIYNKLGFTNGYITENLQLHNLDWDFSKFTPELVVINLGSNDFSYCQHDKAKQLEYVTGYVSFLKQVREKNPNATLLCTFGIMGDILYPSVQKAVADYTSETGDTKVYSLKFDVQVSSDGFGACWHPSEKTHKKAADKLTEEIKVIMGW